MKKILILIIASLCFTIYYLGIVKDVFECIAIGIIMVFLILIMAICVTIFINMMIGIYEDFKDWLK